MPEDWMMPTELKPIEELPESVRKELFESTSKKKVIEGLVKQGYFEESATQFVDNVEQAVQQYQQSLDGQRATQVRARKYKRHMLYGILLTIVFSWANVVTLSAPNASGEYRIWFGVPVVGFIWFLWALFGWLKIRKRLNH